MPKKMVMVDYSKCDPRQCPEGICLSTQECANSVLTQEEPYEMPDINPAMCVGCGLCVPACPLKAVQMI